MKRGAEEGKQVRRERETGRGKEGKKRSTVSEKKEV